jgi:transposase
VRDYLTQQNVDLLPWPAVSPDLSPIEHVWDEMERRLRHLPNQPVTLAEMGPALIHNIPQAFFNNLVRSMRRRSPACINANGGHTRY